MATTKKSKKSRQAKKVRRATTQQRRHRTSESGTSKQLERSPSTVEEPLAETPAVQRAYTAVAEHFMKTGRAPHYTELAATLGSRPEEARQVQHKAPIEHLQRAVELAYVTRNAQKKYFKTRRQDDLIASKSYESQLDRKLAELGYKWREN